MPSWLHDFCFGRNILSQIFLAHPLALHLYCLKSISLSLIRFKHQKNLMQPGSRIRRRGFPSEQIESCHLLRYKFTCQKFWFCQWRIHFWIMLFCSSGAARKAREEGEERQKGQEGQKGQKTKEREEKEGGRGRARSIWLGASRLFSSVELSLKVMSWSFCPWHSVHFGMALCTTRQICDM